MSKLNVACLLSPMADTEGPMDIVDGKALTGPKKIMGKYGEVGLEATITFGEESPNQVHTDILSVGKSKELVTIQQQAIAMIQPGKHPGTLGVHAVEIEDIDNKDAFEVADILVAMIQKLENKPDMIFAGRESWDYGHGIVGPAVAQKLGLPYYSGVNEVKPNGDGSVMAFFIKGNDKLVCKISLPAVFGTTDWLNGKDSARFTSLKGVMAAKKFQRNTIDLGSLGLSGSEPKTEITSVAEVKSERKNHKLTGDDGAVLARSAVEILIQKDKALVAGGGSSEGSSAHAEVSWENSGPLAAEVVVIADHDGKSVRKSTLQTLSVARKIADASGKSVTLLVFAENASGAAAGSAGFGADRVVAVSSPAFKHPSVEAYVQGLQNVLTEAPSVLITVASDLGRDVAAYMASTYGGGLLQDITGINTSGALLAGTRIVSNARYTTNESIKVSGKCQVVSVRATAFDPNPDPRPVSWLKVDAGSISLKSEVASVEAGEQTQGVPLNEAKIIVSGGRGMKAAENFAHLRTLSNLLGGAVGASRAVTDLEWVPHNLQIGQTGTTVAPDVYFAVGISGAIQHLTGMLGSKYIIAINPDADAPIHKHADISIVAKWELVLEALTAELKKALG